jgi:amino acid transporter
LYAFLISFFIIVNIRGARQGIRFVEWVTLFKLVPLAAIIIFGITQVKASNLHWEHLPQIKTFGETALVLFYAFAGFETPLSSSGEVENPKRNIPRGILLGGVSVFIVYIIIQLVVQGALGEQIKAFKDAPLAAVADKIIGPAGVTILLVTAIVSSLGVVIGDILASPRLLFAGANDGLFPKFLGLGKVHRKFSTPYVAIIEYGSLIFIFSISGGFKELAILASGSLLLIYLGVVLAMVRMRFKKGESAAQDFKAPGGLTFPIIAALSIVWLLSHLNTKEIAWTAIFVASVMLLYLLMKLVKRAA